MQKSLVEMTADIVSANVSGRSHSSEELAQQIQDVFRSLKKVNHEITHEGTTLPITDEPHITRTHIRCQECGKKFKLLSNRHLALHGMDAAAYRTKYGIARSTALSSTGLSATRRKIAKERGLGDKLVEYRRNKAGRQD